MRLQVLTLFCLLTASAFAATGRSTRIQWFALDWISGMVLVRAADQVDGHDIIKGPRYFVGALPEGVFRELTPGSLGSESKERAEIGTVHLGLGAPNTIVANFALETAWGPQWKSFVNGTVTVGHQVFTLLPEFEGLRIPSHWVSSPTTDSLTADWFAQRRASEMPMGQLTAAQHRLQRALAAANPTPEVPPTPTSPDQLREASIAWSRLPIDLRSTPSPSDVRYFLEYKVKELRAEIGTKKDSRRVYVSLAPHSRYALRLTIRDNRRRVFFSELAVSVFDPAYAGRDAWRLHSLNASVLLLGDGSIYVTEHDPQEWRMLGWVLRHSDLSVRLGGKEGPVASAPESRQRVGEMRSESWEVPLQLVPPEGFPPEPLTWVELQALAEASFNEQRFWKRLALLPLTARASFFSLLTEGRFEGYVFASAPFAEATAPEHSRSCATHFMRLPKPSWSGVVPKQGGRAQALQHLKYLFAQYGL